MIYAGIRFFPPTIFIFEQTPEHFKIVDIIHCHWVMFVFMYTLCTLYIVFIVQMKYTPTKLDTFTTSI